MNILLKIPRWWCAVAALAFIGLLFWGGRQPVAVGLFRPPYDLLAHLAAYGALTALLWLALGRRLSWLVVAGVGVVAALDELQQTVLPGRHATWIDGSMDILAAVVVVVLLNTWVIRGGTQ